MPINYYVSNLEPFEVLTSIVELMLTGFYTILLLGRGGSVVKRRTRSERSRFHTPRPPCSFRLEQDTLSSPKYW